MASSCTKGRIPVHGSGDMAELWPDWSNSPRKVSKMIANGRFWTNDRVADRTIDLQTGKNRLFGISFPEGMIQDPCNQIDGGVLNVRPDPLGYNLRRSTSCIPPEKGCPEPLQVAQKGEFRYMGWQICQFCSLIALIRYELASKMIANGCFWTNDRVADRTVDCGILKKPVFLRSSGSVISDGPSRMGKRGFRISYPSVLKEITGGRNTGRIRRTTNT
jgi:hypothetical protein